VLGTLVSKREGECESSQTGTYNHVHASTTVLPSTVDIIDWEGKTGVPLAAVSLAIQKVSVQNAARKGGHAVTQGVTGHPQDLQIVVGLWRQEN